MITFKIQTEYIELHQLLKATGLCGTGGEAKQYITEGYVLVDGVTETRKGKKLRPGQTVEFNGEKVMVG